MHLKIVSLKDVINYIGEGSKPIFDREEIKKAAQINEVEERRTVVAVDGEQSGMQYRNIEVKLF